ncbi:MAG TPA: EamA family transporter RarD [Polyangiaceae bacterium]|nr:EamA family transporter RarD [Polyangiaceae bacterium]
MSQRRLGILFSLTAYGIWGLIPLYFRAVHAVSPFEVLSHRIVWSFVLLLAVLAGGRQFAWLRQLRERPSILLSFLASAALLTINWFVYISAVVAGHVVDASLGYFINPLLSVVLAVLFLRERLRALQWVAVSVAALGVLWLTVLVGHLPWIALTLAVSFGLYGLLRKTAALDALVGLALETTLLLPPALAYLYWLARTGNGAWAGATLNLKLLLIAGGPITAVPLLCFAAGARRIPLSLVGILQYLGPTLQLLLGIWVFHEAFAPAKMAGFSLIWGAVLLFSIEGFVVARRSAAVTTPTGSTH